MRLIAIIQARTGSTRFPGKVLANLHGRPLLAHVSERVAQLPDLAAIVLTTPISDYGLFARCPEAHAWVPRAPLDVLGGFARAAELLRADAVVRITGDCPLLNPMVGAEAIRRFVAEGWDYLGTTRPVLWAYDGWDIEVIRREALEVADREAVGEDREHVTAFVWRQPERFRVALGGWCVGCCAPIPDADHAIGCAVPTLKLSVDTPEDLHRVQTVPESALLFGLARDRQ